MVTPGSRALFPFAARAAALVVLAASAARAQAPDGFRTHSDAESGVTFYYPVDYQEIPLPPTEQACRARYVRMSVPDVLKAKKIAIKPSFDVYLLEAVKGGVTVRGPSPAKPAPPPDDPEPDDGAESAPASRPESGPASRPAPRTRPGGPEIPKNLKEAMLAEGRIEGFEQFKERRLLGWTLTPIGPTSGPVKEYSLVRDGTRGARPYEVAFLATREEGGRTLCVLGRTASAIEKESQAEFRRVFKSLKLVGQKTGADAATAAYSGKTFRDIPHRIEVRRGLAKGWRALDTQNFIVVYHTDNEKLVNKIGRDLEAVRPLYERLFPPVRAVTAVSVVRVCKDQQEYMNYGAPAGTGGFWHPGNEELVFFDYYQTLLERESKKGRRITDADTLLVLYHEAFHQYIYYAVGEISPHYWFNEGHGDYFSGAVIPQYGTQVTSLGPSKWRVDQAKELAEATKPGWVGLQKLVHAPREEYYAPQQALNYYACGWALVYFLRESPEVKKNPKWASICTTYFDVLKTEYAKASAGFGADANLLMKEVAGGAAREAAIKKAFEGVDFAEMEKVWRAFICKMKDPWVEERK